MNRLKRDFCLSADLKKTERMKTEIDFTIAL